jgi:hypothetical protein
MRFMLIAKSTKESEAGMPPSPQLMAAIGAFAHDMIRKGILVDQGGLYPSAAGARVRTSGGEMLVSDGPFMETKELIGGYAIVNAASLAEAVELSKQFLQLHLDVLGSSYEAESEVRQMYEMPPG